MRMLQFSQAKEENFDLIKIKENMYKFGFVLYQISIKGEDFPWFAKLKVR